MVYSFVMELSGFDVTGGTVVVESELVSTGLDEEAASLVGFCEEVAVVFFEEEPLAEVAFEEVAVALLDVFTSSRTVPPWVEQGIN